MPEANDPQSNPNEPEHGETFEAFWDRLQRRRTTGAKARAALIARMSTMTEEELHRVPTTVVGWLGPQGLATLLSRSRSQGLRATGAGVVVLQRLEPVSPVGAALKPRKKLRDVIADLQKRQPLPWTASLSFVSSLGVAAGLVVVTPPAWRLITDASPPGTPRLCRELDRWTGDCRYVIGSRTLTLSRAAALLHLSPEVLLQANPQRGADAPLQVGGLLVVPRRIGLNLR